jgi:molybdopterin synthase catalytic subunit
VNPDELLGKFLNSLGEDAGAVAIFIGRVKGKVGVFRVFSLSYETAEPHSTQSLEKIAREELEKNSLQGVMIYHKRGEALPGEPVLFIAVASKARKEAIRVLESTLERVKHEAYVWKLEKREDGEFWIVGDGMRVPRQKSKQ